MNKKFVQDGVNTFIFEFDESFAKDKLPAAIYTVCYSQMQGFYLQKNKDNFTETGKNYGSLNSRADRIIKTYESRDVSTGVLLTGLKGSGKTLLSQTVSNKMIEKGLPIVLVESAFTGDAFINFLSKIGECVLIFDEFAKVFDARSNDEKDKQNGLLGIFDGNKSLKRLIFVIENNSYSLNEFYKNRPGRLFYHFEYSKLEEVVIDEYCADKKIADTVKIEIKSAFYRIRNFSFDILKAIIDEHLRFPQDTILDIVGILNVETDAYTKTMLTLNKVLNKNNEKQYEYHFGPKELEYTSDVCADLFIKQKGLEVPPDADLYEMVDNKQLELVRISKIIFENATKVVFENSGFIFEFDKTIKNNYSYDFRAV